MHKSGEFFFKAYIENQIAWSLETFGPGPRTESICNHVKKELCEIEKAPNDLEEWIDVIILGLDGAWRSGASPEDIVAMLREKAGRNHNRKWPDWRTLPDGVPSEHIRGEDGE